MVYRFSSVSSKEYHLTAPDGGLAGNVTYSSWLTEAWLKTDDGELRLKQKNFWSTSLLIWQNTTCVGELTSNWKGEIIINLRQPSHLEMYRVKGRGFLNYHFILLNRDGVALATITPSFKWSKLSYEFSIETHRNDSTDNRLLLLAAHSAQHTMTILGLVLFIFFVTVVAT